ncbi:MAG: hypothetical protein IJ458_04755 [Clostridia bacterium]|nr:hypothetical protein [Clostridia bacterium]
MENIQFTEKELKYINASILDKTHDIHIDGIQTIKATLPKGKYNIFVAECEDRLTICDDLRVFYNIKATPSLIKNRFGVEFAITANMKIEFSLVHERYECFAYIIHSLREQVICNRKILKQKKERLIEKDIKSRSTNLGEDYNRNSFFETIWECTQLDETLDVDLSKSPKDNDVNLLQFAKIQQDKLRLRKKQQELDMEAMEIAIREQELMKY